MRNVETSSATQVPFDGPPHPQFPISRILIVDDEEDVRQLFRARLTALGYQVSAVPNGEASLHSLHRDASDIVFLDLAMTGMDGLETLRRIRDREFDVAVILTTAHGSEDVAVDALRMGADDYLRKPFTGDDLGAVLDRTIQKLSAARQQAMLRQQLGDELQQAAKIQSDLLPTESPALDGWEFVAHCVPARAVGGDFYDWQQPSDNLLTITVGDVMGKGMPAALLMSSVRAVLRAAGQDQTPAQAVQAAAASLASDLSRSGSFVTLFHARLDLTSGELRYVDAGHGYALLCRADGRTEGLPAGALPLGVLDNEVYSEGVVTLGPGDVLVIHSDGLTQALPEAFRLGTRDAMPFGPEASAAAIAQDLIARATSAGALSDDLTVGVLRRTAAAAPVTHSDPVLKDLVPRFLSRRWQDVTVIGEELALGGFRAIERMGHNLKGTGRGYGFDGISEIGAALEVAAQQHDASAIRAQASALRDYLTRVGVPV